jgi:hypothetical protein
MRPDANLQTGIVGRLQTGLESNSCAMDWDLAPTPPTPIAFPDRLVPETPGAGVFSEENGRDSAAPSRTFESIGT